MAPSGAEKFKFFVTDGRVLGGAAGSRDSVGSILSVNGLEPRPPKTEGARIGGNGKTKRHVLPTAVVYTIGEQTCKKKDNS